MNPLNIRGGMRNATYRGSMHREQIEEDRLRETSFGRTINSHEKPKTIESIKKILPSDIIALENIPFKEVDNVNVP